MVLPVAGQLAITEVLSAPSTNGQRGDDFWELTNFGSQSVDLTTYWFRDDGGFLVPGAENLAALWADTRLDEPRIEPGESIVFVKEQLDVLVGPADFRRWWGDALLSPDLKIVFYRGHGISADGERVHLWQVTAERTNLVQEVVLPAARPGRSFTYDPQSGELAQVSIAGVDRAFAAATSDDVGSPGVTIGPVALRLDAAPDDLDVDGGAPATLTVRASGLPAPQYQWWFDGVRIEGATAATLTIMTATGENAGPYVAEVTNGREQLFTPPATLTVNQSPSCARIVRPLTDLEVTPGQSACFVVETRGFPLPSFQWSYNGVEIPGATGAAYSVTAMDAGQAGIYSVRVSNPLCSTNARARLTVAPVPHLAITEAMTAPVDGIFTGHDSWWELTNQGTNAVNLRGYRWDDSSPSLSGAVVVTNDIALAPGQSAIVVSSMSPDAFRRWWGEENLPARLPIVSHAGNGLSRQSSDSVTLWNATARDEDDYVFSFGVRDQSDPPGVGASLECDPDFGDCGIPSTLGERGAFRAAEGGDLGSPGWTSNEQRAAPRYLTLRRDVAQSILRWKSEPGRTYAVQARPTLDAGSWTTLVRLVATGPWLSTTDPANASSARRFYRVMLVPPAL